MIGDTPGTKRQPLQDPIDLCSALSALLQISPSAVIGLDAGGRVLLWNTAAERIFGWTAQEVIGNPLPTIPSGSEDEFRILLESQMHGISQHGRDVIRRRKDGSLCSLKLWTAPLHDNDHRVVGKLAILSDTSEINRVKQERELLASTGQQASEQAHAMERFRDLLEAAPDSIIEVDEGGVIVLVNAATEQMFGYLREELQGRNIDLLVPEELRHRHAQNRAAYANLPTRRPMGTGIRLYGQKRDGTKFPVEISLSPVHSPEGLRISAAIRDVTDRQNAEQDFRDIQARLTAELSRTNRELEVRSREAEEANRLKSEFLASISHELRTPLHTIIGFSELLGEELEGALNDKQRRFVGHIHKDSLHLLELINDLLDLSKIEAGRLDLHLETFDATQAAREELNSVAPAAQAKHISLEFAPCAPIPVHADRIRFRQILLNLLSNGVKFTPEGGCISVDCSSDGKIAQFCVADSGLGIPRNEHATIFDKFHQVGSTTNGVREGTGLGLAITKHLVEQHNGRIWVDSEPGNGSKFCFTLPIASFTSRA
ncbi:MAG: PAS domain S-box protein [Bryobacteraceae bacterium]